MGTKNFDSIVTARTTAARQIRDTPALFALYVELGGTREDLDAIIEDGQEAEALNHAQVSSQADGKLATIDVVKLFGAIQREYVGLLFVLRAIRGQLARANAQDPNVAKLDEIIANHAAVIVHELPAGADGKKQRKTSTSKSQEAIRAEIQADAHAVLAFEAIATTLNKRKWPKARVTKLHSDAVALTGKLGDRTTKKGAAKDATKAEADAVTRQRAAWDSAYGLLSALGRKDARVQLLLRDASR